MNEHVKELAERAGIQLFEDKSFGWSVLAGTDNNLKKFAELIVKECCDIVRQCRFAPDEDAIVNEIVHHFGVEE